jgi:sn-glycerol 3-phosphate transport system permease protein
MSASSSSIAGSGQRSIHAWLLLLPALVVLVAFTHWPAVATLIDSFYSTPKGARAAVWVGIENYEAMADDPVFWQAVRNNLWFAAATIPASIGLALLMAVWVNERIAGRTFVRMAYFTPTVLPMIAVANIWLFFYTPQYGLLEQVTGALGLPSHNWLGNPQTVLGALMVVAVWKEAGFFMIFYLAALQQIYRNTFGQGSLDDHFEKTYYSHIMGLRKPDRESYQYIITENGLDAGRTLFVDDALVNVDGAIAAGLQGYFLQPGTSINEVDW